MNSSIDLTNSTCTRRNVPIIITPIPLFLSLFFFVLGCEVVNNNASSLRRAFREKEFPCFQVAVNPEFKVGEMSFDNNAAICRLLYTETFATVHSCIMARP